MDGGVYRRGQLRHGCARGTADGPNGTEIRRVGVRATHVRRMDADIVRSAGERNDWYAPNRVRAKLGDVSRVSQVGGK